MDVGRPAEVWGLSGWVQGVNIVNEPEQEVGRVTGEICRQWTHSGHTHTLLIPQRWIQRSVQRSREVNMHGIYKCHGENWSKITLIHINTEEKVTLTSDRTNLRELSLWVCGFKLEQNWFRIRSPEPDDKGLTDKNLTWVDFLTFWTRQATTILRRQKVFVIEKPDLLPGELEWSCADYKWACRPALTLMRHFFKPLSAHSPFQFIGLHLRSLGSTIVTRLKPDPRMCGARVRKKQR